MVDAILQNLINGDLFTFLGAIFIQSMGTSFYGFIIMIFTVPIYQRTESMELVAILWLTTWTVIESLVPGPIYSLGKLMIALSLGVLLFRAFMGRGHSN
jgi:hypothetical protein